MEVYKDKNLTISYKPELFTISYEWTEGENSKDRYTKEHIFEKFVPAHLLIPAEDFSKQELKTDTTWIDSRVFFIFTKEGTNYHVVIVSSELFRRIEITPTNDDYTAQNYIRQFFYNYQNFREWYNPPVL